MELQPFAGNQRYDIVRTLGSGTAGVVYEAWDRERRMTVALKLLHQTDPTTLYRFKQEFRALAHINHPNLVPLYELQHIDDDWFVTMELVDGVDFITWVREARTVEAGTAALEERLRPAARQLAEGIAALHASGRMHRDVKPSNVLVNREGQVVVLDFGLVTSTHHETIESITEDILGTPAYMAPEQGAGDEQDVTEPADWYGVGTLLYEAMTGAPPFEGQFVQVLLAKQRGEPPTLRDKLPEVSEELSRLCADLLRFDPRSRPGGLEVLERLGSKETTRLTSTVGVGPTPLVGREAHLAEMWQAFDRLRHEQAVTLFIHGASGLGKTVLVRRFLQEVRLRHPEAVTLMGRCYENETVPYKAFDTVIDQLTRFLRSLPYRDAAGLLPRDVLVLARLFPVLKRVKAVADAGRRVLEIPDSHELRRRAFAALREVLNRVAEDQPLILFIDDLQWGDADSALLLADVMRPPDPPPLLFIGAYRAEDASGSLFLNALDDNVTHLDETRPGASESLVVSSLEVGELSAAASVDLVLLLLGPEEGDGRAKPQMTQVARTIARDAHGNPLFIDELVRHILAQGDAITVSQVSSLDEVLRVRVEALPRDARDLLEVLAVAGRPTEPDTAGRAAEIDTDGLSAFTELRLGNLARSTGTRRDDPVEIWNDRVRTAVLATLEPPRRRVTHLRLAREIEATGRGSPELLAHHFAAAGETARALEYTVEAAEASSKALAFNRAARLYRQALELIERPAQRPPGGTEGGKQTGSRSTLSTSTAIFEQARALRQHLSAVLVNAGRGAEAAKIYLELAEDTVTAEEHDMKRQAAYYYLISGHIDRGLETLDEVLAQEGMKLPASSRASRTGFLLRRFLLRLRGLRFKARDASQLPAADLAKIDTCWSAATGLALVDPLRGADFQARHLKLALDAGEPYRVARAFALEAGYTAMAGSRRRRRTQELLQAADEMVRRCGDPHAFGLATLMRGIAAVLEGRFLDSLDVLSEAEEILRDRCTGVIWELDNAHFFTLLALLYLGEIRQLQRRLPVQLKEARERGDLYAWTSMECRIAWFVHLTQDDPERARQALDEGIAQWSRGGPHLQHLWNLFGNVEIDLYEGRAEAADQRLDERWGWLADSSFLGVRGPRVEALFLRARAALALAAERRKDAGAAEELFTAAARDAARIGRQGAGWSAPQVRLIEASVAAGRGRREEALFLLAKVEDEFLRNDLGLFAAVVQRRRGFLLGGDAGVEIVTRGERWMLAQEVRDPERMTALYAPGPWGD